MKRTLLQYLACPSCNGDIRLEAGTEGEDREILDGLLSCAKCAQHFPIVRGVPRFVDLGKVDEEQAATASNFGWQWQHFTQQDDRYGEQMLGWLQPVKPEFFKDKLVLEGGCGKGRHTLLAASWGSRDVIGVDISDAVESAFAATRNTPNIHIVQADLCHLPLKQVFDYAFSIGVIHHLGQPQVGFRALASRIKRGGLSRRGCMAQKTTADHSLCKSITDPFHFHHESGHPAASLKLPAALVYAATKLVYGPLNKSRSGAAVANQLSYNDYLNSISKFGWREQHTMCLIISWRRRRTMFPAKNLWNGGTASVCIHQSSPGTTKTVGAALAGCGNGRLTGIPRSGNISKPGLPFRLPGSKRQFDRHRNAVAPGRNRSGLIILGITYPGLKQPGLGGATALR